MKFEFDQGWLRPCRHEPSPHKNDRPNAEVSLLVIHNISLPAGCFGGEHIDALFKGCIDADAHPSFQELVGLEVSAHFLIRRDGQVTQYVSCDERAWHAGVSEFQGRQQCNDFSIGIELEGADDIDYTCQQYSQLQRLTLALLEQYPMLDSNRIVGHSDIAPGRKTDPGLSFDWPRYLKSLA